MYKRTDSLVGNRLFSGTVFGLVSCCLANVSSIVLFVESVELYVSG